MSRRSYDRWRMPVKTLIPLGIALFFLPSASLASEVVLNAPFDGIIVKIPNKGQAFEKGTKHLLSWRVEIEKYNKQGSAAFTEFQAFVGPKELGQAPDIPSVVEVFSPLLEIQSLEESRKIDHAKEIIARLKERIGLETELKALEDEIELAAFESQQKYYNGKMKRGSQIGFDANDVAYVRQRNTTIYEKRKLFRDKSLARVVDHDLKTREADANRSLESAQNSKNVINVTQMTGKIFCPFKCSVSDVYVAEGQWVTRGDALIKVSPH